MPSTLWFYFPDSCFSSEPPWWCQMWLLAFLLLLFLCCRALLPLSACPALLTLAAPFLLTSGHWLETASTVPQPWYFSMAPTPPLSPRLLLNSYTIKWSQQERPASSLTAGRRFKGRSVWGFQAQVTEELWEVQCIQMPGVVGSELSYKDMHNT